MSDKTRKPYVKRSDVDWYDALSYAEIGLTYEQIADALCVSYESMLIHRKENADFEAALKQARAKGVARRVDKLIEHIESDDKASLFFWLKCKGGFSENQGIIDKIVKELAELKGEATE